MALEDDLQPIGRDCEPRIYGSNPCAECSYPIAECSWLHKGQPVEGWIAEKRPSIPTGEAHGLPLIRITSHIAPCIGHRGSGGHYAEVSNEAKKERSLLRMHG